MVGEACFIFIRFVTKFPLILMPSWTLVINICTFFRLEIFTNLAPIFREREGEGKRSGGGEEEGKEQKEIGRGRGKGEGER